MFIASSNKKAPDESDAFVEKYLLFSFSVESFLIPSRHQ